MSVRSWLFRGSLSLLGASAVACTSSVHEGPTTEIAQGKRYESNDPEYDRFFAAVHALQVQLGEAPDELAAARRNLSEGAPSRDASSRALAENVKRELDRLARRGARLRVDVRAQTPRDASSHVISNNGGALTESDAQLVRRLDAGASTLLQLSSSLDEAHEQLLALCTTAEHLEARLDSAFPKRIGSRRGAVLANLRDAERLITLMIARVDQLQTPADEFATRFASVVGQPLKPPPPSPEPPAPIPDRVLSRAEHGGDTSDEPNPASSPETAAPAEPVTRSEFEP